MACGKKMLLPGRRQHLRPLPTAYIGSVPGSQDNKGSTWPAWQVFDPGFRWWWRPRASIMGLLLGGNAPLLAHAHIFFLAEEGMSQTLTMPPPLEWSTSPAWRARSPPHPPFPLFPLPNLWPLATDRISLRQGGGRHLVCKTVSILVCKTVSMSTGLK